VQADTEYPEIRSDAEHWNRGAKGYKIFNE